MELIQQKFEKLCARPSDINEHLPVLSEYAKQCESIIECGVRDCVSTWALAYGLLQNNKSSKYLLLNDLYPCNIDELLTVTKELPLRVHHEWKNDLLLTLDRKYDMIFIDTWHVYGHLKRELEKFSPFINKYIILHDTTVDEIEGETIRLGMDAQQQSLETGYPVEEICCGLGRALDEFLQAYGHEWQIVQKLTNNNGLTVLERRKEKTISRPPIVVVSGYFNPLHVGHIEYLQKAKEIAGQDGKLVVIVNNDCQSFLKKGTTFMKERERVEIIRQLRMVDEVVLSIDKDRTVRRTLQSIEPRPTHFCNGGDQNNDIIPEAQICRELGIHLVDGLGDKIQSSSWLLQGLTPS